MKRLIKVLIFALAAFLIWNLTGKTAETVPERETERNLEDWEPARYAYDILDPDGQILYREIYETIITFSYETEVSANSAEEMSRIAEHVLADHPEIFYIDGFDLISSVSEDGVSKFIFRPVYTMNREEIRDRQKQVSLAAEQILSGLPQSSDDYFKIKYLYEYLIRNTEYKEDAMENQSLVSALVYRESVCQGYAKAFQYLCHEAGIQAVLIGGTAEGAGHAWIIVNSNGNWYHTDPTWGDVIYRQAENGEEDHSLDLPQISYDHLLITTDQILLSHTIEVPFPVPVCDSTADNYYVREGLLLEEFSEAAMEVLFRNALDQGMEQLTFKCSDMAVFETCHQELIGEQKVFDYLPEVRNLTYIESPDQLTMTFWLKAK